MARTKYYKLGTTASVFFDPRNNLKVTKGVPSKTNQPSKNTLGAARAGHIIEISETEYNEMMGKLPEKTKAAVEKEQKLNIKPTKPAKEEPKKKVEDEDEDEDEDEQDDNKANENLRRENLLKRLKALKLKDSKFEKIAKKSNDDLELYLEQNEEAE